MVFRYGGISGGAVQYKWKRCHTKLVATTNASVNIWLESFGDFDEGWGPTWSTASSVTPAINSVTNLTEIIKLNNPNHHQHAAHNDETGFALGKYIIESGESGRENSNSVAITEIKPGNVFYYCPSSAYAREDRNSWTMYGITKYNFSEVDVEYVYSEDREAYPDSGNDGEWIYKYIGEASLLNAPIFATGTCTNGYTIEVGFSPILVIAMNNTRSHLLIAMKNSACIIQAPDRYGDCQTAFNSTNVCTNTGFKSPLTGNFIAFG